MTSAATRPQSMLTEQQCLAKAVEMDERALEAACSTRRADFLAMARSWRGVAWQAAWQDDARYRC